MSEATETIRLHISPFTPEILPSVLPASVRNSATEISFHKIVTFPENDYGYVTLPKMEAERIKKKLNGSMLKGKKFKVEAARPQKRHREEEEEVVPEGPSSTKKKSKKSKKQESEDGVLEGFELPSHRKVKRGWTETGEAKQERRKSEKRGKQDKETKLQPKSKYSDQSECLFRATIPPNRAANAAADDKKAKKKKSKDNVVHEFTNLVTQPSFLRTAEHTAPITAKFEEGQGWVDTEGNLVEAASEKITKYNKRPGMVAGAKEKHRATKSTDQKKQSRKEKTPEESSESEDYTSSSGSSAEESSDSESEAEEDTQDSSESSGSDNEEVNEKVKLQVSQEESRKSPETSEAEPESSQSSPEDTTSEATKPEDLPAKEVHPLEALFKRAAPTASDDQATAEPEAGFSFFGNDIESEDEQPEPQPPFTPFTKNDLQNRGQRSAAPTPDTTAATRHTKWNESEDSDDSSIDSPVKARAGTNEETEFAKWFWENRGENNRAWKKRRRDMAKQSRQRANRKGFKGRS